MAKKEIKSLLKTKEETININTMAIINNNKISYTDNNIINIVTINEEEVVLIRKNDEYQLTMGFNINKSYCEYKLLDMNRIMNLDLNTKELVIKEGYVYIKYKINDEINEFELNY